MTRVSIAVKAIDDEVMNYKDAQSLGTLSLSLSPLPLSLFYLHTHTFTYSFSFFHSLSISFFLCHSFNQSLSLYSLTISHSFSVTPRLTHSHSHLTLGTRVSNLNSCSKSLAVLHADLLYNLFRLEIDLGRNFM